MTITTEDRKRYQSTVKDFARQKVENACLSRAIQNILKDLADRHGVSDLRISHEDILNICHYDEMLGCRSDVLPENLNASISEFGYRAIKDTNVGLDGIASIVNNEMKSYPIVELSPEYLHDQDGYDVKAGMYGQAEPHTVVVFTINDNSIQFFDPYAHFYSPPETGGAPPSQLPKSRFLHYWSGREEYQWTLHVERVEQLTLNQVQERID